MLKYFGKQYDYTELNKRVANFSQLAGARRFIFNSGKSKGVEAVDVRTGSGLTYIVLLDRGFDIAWAEYKGVPLSYISGTGVVSPAHYEPENEEWLRSFCGGLLTTCGLTQVGNPCEFNGVSNGLHGRISNIPADNICLEEQWDGNDYVISLKGQVRQVKSCVENMIMHRTIKSFAGKNKIVVEDTIENKGYTRQPFMILYHCNLGFPLLNENSAIIIPNRRISSMFKDKEFDIPNYGNVEAPMDYYEERVFYFDTLQDDSGYSYACILNNKHFPTLALKIKYNKDILDNLVQWKQLTKGDYVIGIEPCNNHILGIKHQYENNSLKYLNPLEKVKTYLEFEVFDDKNDIDNLIETTKRLSD
ncbi:MAG: hypothetical protein A2Y21_03790 [Clostridiales bacterium GWC2_40_7]|nr:MAG: hypothetical protein A2Y21_03790 [Clostridiales bacterium GWC2_40_7]